MAGDGVRAARANATSAARPYYVSVGDEEQVFKAAFRRGLNPYAHDHKHLEKHHQVHVLPGGPYLLQVAHGNNLSNRLPAWWRIDRRVSRKRLTAFGVATT